LLEQAFRFSHVRAPLQQHRSIADRKRQDVPALRQPTPAANGGHFGAASSHTQHSGANLSCNILGFYFIPSIVCALVGLAAALAVPKRSSLACSKAGYKEVAIARTSQPDSSVGIFRIV
jgi:hypothetical protein